jgi:phospholipid/cholesterol/gamma-HCH transport system substrate-binding protein
MLRKCTGRLAPRAGIPIAFGYTALPSQQEVRWSQLKVGILVIVALVTLTVLILLMSGSVGGLFSPKLKLRSYFENAAGLKVGAPVMLEGVAVGEVKSIRLVSDPSRKLTPVEVVMQISGQYRSGLHRDSKSALNTIGVLGDTVVDINSQLATGPLVQNGDELPTTETPSLTDVIKASQGTIEQLNTILAKVNLLADNLVDNKGSIGLLLNSPDLYNKANDAVTHLQQLLDGVTSGKGSIGKLVTDDQLYNRLNDTTAKLQDIATQIDEGKGSVGKLVKDPELYNNANQTIAKLNSLMTDINAGKGGLGVVAKDPQFAAQLKDSVAKLDDLLAQIDAGQGSVGKLMKDPSLYNNADQMLVETRGLIKAVRENPKKYLTIHMKIF